MIMFGAKQFRMLKLEKNRANFLVEYCCRPFRIVERITAQLMTQLLESFIDIGLTIRPDYVKKVQNHLEINDQTQIGQQMRLNIHQSDFCRYKPKY